MLIGNFDTLRSINFLHFLQDIVLYFHYACDFQQFLRIDLTFGQLIAGNDFRSDFQPGANCLCQIAFVFDAFFFIGDDNPHAALVFQFADVGDFTVNLGQDCDMFRTARFKQFFNSRQTLCDITIIAGSYAAGMESTHGQMSTGFTNRLSRHDPNRFTRFRQLAGRHVAAVALAADAVGAFAGKGIADIGLRDAGIDNTLRHGFIHIGIGFNQNLTGLRIDNRILAVAAN